MFQVVTSTLFAVAALASMAAIAAMVRNNQSAIWSALRGRGAFPAAPAPEKGPTAQVSQIFVTTRSMRRNEYRSRKTAMLPFSRAA